MSLNYTFCNAPLQCNNRNAYSPDEQDLAETSEHATKNGIYRILEIIHSTRDIQIQIKLIANLTVHMMTNSTDKDIIIKFNPIYDKICEILTKGHQKKCNISLSFLATLLHTEDEDTSTRGRTLVLYAQNMIRASGCLKAMANLFTNGLLHHDTSQALCRCLAESCAGMEINQNYCSHLIPYCVRRCRPGNEQIFQVVQSLLSGNERNVQLFCNSGGSRMFNREFLKYDRCLQLLNTVVSNAEIRTKILESTEIISDLHDLKQLYGSTSHVGQWITIIFYTINLKGQDFVKEIRDIKHSSNTEENNPDVINDRTLHIPNANSLNIDRTDDTSELLRNIVNEVLNFKQRKNPNLIKTPQYNNNNRTDKKINTFIRNIEDSMSINKRNETKPNIPSTSLLFSNNSVNTSTNLNSKDEGNYNCDENICNKENSILEKTDTLSKYVSRRCNKKGRKEITHESILDFKPMSTSTPKPRLYRSSNLLPPRPIHKKYKKQNISIVSKLKVHTETKNDESVKSKKNGASRILEFINETCTIIMKNVTDAFKSKKPTVGDTSRYDNSITGSLADSHSFTNYMRERDALLEQDSSSSDHLMDAQYECNTCNNTLALKRKFHKDAFLKETVNKLKLGINLYGCNFKKISKTFWRDESYMTPSVLYNLYRKLILK